MTASRITDPTRLALSRLQTQTGTGLLAKRDSFLLRIDPKILAAIRRWADDDLRSVNGQLEYLLRRALKDADRLPNDGKESRTRKSRRRDS